MFDPIDDAISYSIFHSNEPNLIRDTPNFLIPGYSQNHSSGNLNESISLGISQSSMDEVATDLIFTDNLDIVVSTNASEDSQLSQDDLTGEASPEQPIIGVIDTGFSANHPDLDYSRIQLGRDRIDNDNNPLTAEENIHDHGTQILNIIGATQDNGIGIDGLNDDAPLWVGRAVGSGKWAESLVEFVDAAKTSGQPNAVVNLSFDLVQANPDGSLITRNELTSSERAALEYARQNNILVVAAAGNQGGSMSALGQAAQELDNLIVVGAADGLGRADHSSYGNGLTLLAEDDGAGTSVATAQVTGAVSQIWAANPELNYRQVIDVLEATATDLNRPGYDEETGAGLLNVDSALELAVQTAPVEEEMSDEIISSTLENLTFDETALERPTCSWYKPWECLDDAWDKIKGGAKWIYEQADDKLTGSFERAIEWGKKLPGNLKDYGNHFKDLVVAVGNGDLEKAAKAYGSLLVELTEIAGVPEQLESYYDWRKFNTRSLTSREIAEAKTVFGDSINYSLVRIDEGSFLVGARHLISLPFGGDDAPFTTFNTINAWGKMNDEILIHELTHVWQYQNHGAVYLPEAGWAQLTEGRNGAYDYGDVAGLKTQIDKGLGLFNFNREQQAEIVEDYYRIKNHQNPNKTLYAHFVDEVSTLSKGDLIGSIKQFHSNSIESDWVDGWNISYQDQHFVGDFDGDGQDDAFIRSPEYAGLLTHDGTDFNIDSIQFDWIDGWNLGAADQHFVGDFNNDGQDDVFIRSSEYAGLLTYNGTNFQLDSIQFDWINGWNLGAGDQHFVGDFDGDGSDDVFIRSSEYAGLLTYNGTNFQLDSIQFDWINGWNLGAADQHFVGDFDGDGQDDVFIRSSEWAGLLTYNGTDFQLDSIQFDWINGKPQVGGWNMAQGDQHFVGDFDGDGQNDVFIRSPKWAGLLTYNGTNFQVESIQSDWIDAWNLEAEDRHFVGDFDNNGKDDVFVRSPKWAGLLTYNGTNFQVESIQHDQIDEWNLGAEDQHFVGDFDNNGKDEILARKSEWIGQLTYS